MSLVFSIMITSLREEGAGLCASLLHLFVCFVRVSFCHFSSWCSGVAAVCDCGIPWTFLLTCFLNMLFQ